MLRRFIRPLLLVLTTTVSVSCLGVDQSQIKATLAKETLNKLITLASLSGKTILNLRLKLPTGTAAAVWRSINSSLTKLYMKKIFTANEINTLRSLGTVLITPKPNTKDLNIPRTEIRILLARQKTKDGMIQFLEPNELQVMSKLIDSLLKA